MQHLSRRLVVVIVAAAALAVAGCQAGDSLAGPTWEWTSPQAANSSGQSLAPRSASYTIEFLMNGTVNVQADCNRLTGTYAVGVPLDVTITLTTPMPTTCGASSLDRIYLESLGQISSYSTESGVLKLFFEEDAGAMQFRRQGS
jgi:hypothetical protein